MLDWGDERYVRMYTRDTPDFLVLSYEAQGLLELIMRKLDRAGVLPLGKQGKRGVAIAIGHPQRWETIAPALEELLDDGCLVVAGAALVMPNFLEAQTAVQSDRMRQQVHRERRRDLARAQEAGLPVTLRDVESQPVTESHVRSRGVTNGHSDLCLTVPFGEAAAVAPPRVLTTTSPSQPPDPESPPPADVAYGSNGGRTGGGDAPPVDNPATGQGEGSGAKPARRARVAKAPPVSPAAEELSVDLAEAIKSHAPLFATTLARMDGWARDIDLALRVDGRSPEQLRAVIDYVHRSSETFWRANVLSGKKLRAKFDAIAIQMQRAPALPADGTGWRMVASEIRRRRQ